MNFSRLILNLFIFKIIIKSLFIYRIDVAADVEVCLHGSICTCMHSCVCVHIKGFKHPFLGYK